jgi:hypothetical protein
MSDIHEEDSSSGSDSSEEPTLHSLLNRPVETRAQASARQNSASSGHAMASMNAFKNSTRTFATPPVPSDGIRIKPKYEDTEQQETSGSSGSSSSSPTPKCYTAMMDAQMNLFLERIKRDQNIRSPQTTPGIYDILPIVSVKQAPQSEYQRTTTAQSKSFSELKFSNNVSTNRETLKCVKTLLSECGLLSHTDGSR